MGTVYLAESLSLGTLWAIKAINKKADSNYDLLAEPNILKKLNHPALPRIVDIEPDEDCLYIIEDYIEGTPLDRQLQARKYFDEATVIEWAKQLCEVLLYLHGQKPNPIIYRDLKPSNIIVSSDNRVKVIDFGIAREYKTDSGSDTSYMGTRGYAAPEQYGTSQTDERTDIYSLGVTMYHLLTGKSPNEPPYEFQPLRSINQKFSEGIEYIVYKCVQNDPANRYQNAGELLHDLDNIHIFNSVYKKQKAIEKVRYVMKTAMVLAFAFLIYAGTGQLAAEQLEKYEKLVAEGYEALRVNQFTAAETAFDQARKVKKENNDAYLGTAQIYFKQGSYEQCLAYLEQTAAKLAYLPQDSRYNYLAGTVYYEQRDYEKALVYLERAVKASPLEEDYIRDLAVCHAKLGDLSRAQELLDEIRAIEKTDDVSEFVKAQVMLAAGRQDEAVAGFNQVIATTGNEVIKKKAYAELSNIYKDNRGNIPGALEKQIDILERASRDLKDKDDLILTEMLAEAYFTAQRYDNSVQEFNKLLNIGYQRPYIYRNIAIIQQQQGDYQAAENTLKNMIEKYPDDYTCYLRLAFLYLEAEGKKPQSARNYQKVVNNYNLAVRFNPGGAATTDLLPLRNAINELYAKGWL
ncbi:MAG: protein kinase [Firmicutes bacterium]|nr:protein kinase [Bacillota bacterium]